MPKRARRGTAWPKQLPNGRWQAQTQRGQGRVTRSFDLKGDAEWWMAQAKRGHVPDSGLTLAEYLERWLRGKRDVADATRDSYSVHIRHHIAPAVGHIRLAELRARDVEALVDGLSLAPGTITGVLRTLRGALNEAVRRHDVPENVAAHVKPPRVPRKPVEAMTEERLQQILAAVRGSPVEHICRFLAGSGCRISEACHLDQRDVHEGFVSIRTAKGDRPRSTMISEDAAAALAEAIALAPRRGPREPVFFAPRTGDRMTRDSAYGMLQHAMKRAGLPPFHPHGFRHGVATLMVADGMSMRLVAGQLGNSIEVASKTYAHIAPDTQRRAISVLDRAVKETG